MESIWMYKLGNPGVFFFVSLKEIDSGVFVWYKGRQETKHYLTRISISKLMLHLFEGKWHSPNRNIYPWCVCHFMIKSMRKER